MLMTTDFLYVFKSHTHTRIFKSDIAVFICVCDEQFLSLPTQTQTAASPLGASEGAEVCCAI